MVDKRRVGDDDDAVCACCRPHKPSKGLLSTSSSPTPFQHRRRRARGFDGGCCPSRARACGTTGRRSTTSSSRTRGAARCSSATIGSTWRYTATRRTSGAPSGTRRYETGSRASAPTRTRGPGRRRRVSTSRDRHVPPTHRRSDGVKNNHEHAKRATSVCIVTLGGEGLSTTPRRRSPGGTCRSGVYLHARCRRGRRWARTSSP